MSARWQTGWFCVSCDHLLSYREVMYSHGRCPYCGYKGPRAITIVDTKERAYRIVRTGPWWAFWRKRVEWGPHDKAP